MVIIPRSDVILNIYQNAEGAAYLALDQEQY